MTDRNEGEQNRGRAHIVQLDAQVAASPEALWEALATGSGLARWFAREAEVKPGVGGSVRVSWGAGEDWESRIDVWEKDARLVISSEMPGRDGRMVRLAVEFRLETEGGTTRVRLVHSGFGGDGSWDDMIDGLEAGWSYFLANLRHCVERHPGVPRTLLSARPRCFAGVEEGLGAILGARGLGLEKQDEGGPRGIGASELVAGQACSLRLGSDRLQARILAARPPRTVAFVIPALADAVLFVERESLAAEFGLGIWLSLYGLGEERCAPLRRDLAALALRLSELMPLPAVKP